MKKVSFLLMLAIASAPVHANTADEVNKVIKTTVKSNKPSTNKKIIGAVIGSISGLLLIVGGVYYKKHRQGNNKYKKPLLDHETDSDGEVIFDENAVLQNYNNQKSRELILLLKNGTKADGPTLIAAMEKLIAENANPNGSRDANSVQAAIQGGSSIAVFEALIKHNANVSEDMLKQARQNHLDGSIISLLEKKLPPLEVYPADYVCVETVN